MTDAEIDLSMPERKIPMATATAVATVYAENVTDGSKISNNGNKASVPFSPGIVLPSMTPQQIAGLQQQGYPDGLAQELRNTKATYPIRFWVIDNSGSMRSTDGHQLRGTSSTLQKVSCTRWTELQATVEYHAQLAGLIEATTVFRMLNDPGALVGPQEFTVASQGTQTASGDDEVQQAVDIIRKAQPKGVTPLSDHIRIIRARIEEMAPTLLANGQQAVIVLATDGLPSNARGESGTAIQREFTETLRSLQNLPVWVVIRLCTDDDETVDFYNELDQVLELPFEVIDDYFGEGEEVHKANKWVAYGLPLHRCREMGYHHRIFDLLDERQLNKDELLEFLQILYGKDAVQGLPDPQLDWKNFSKKLKTVVHAGGVAFDPTRKKQNYWIDMKALEKCFGSGLFGRFRKR